ncbi:hypothetical protein G4B88_004413 [Cannabis sativa]|uniref:Uncharacterized protein n=1 Tax=Cannabis sativa TaxID=3483 RepID=A0A7J6I2M4_CANSA|nr:hypothetical protein G4B88_004413 [Cannabis sativa]
MEIQARIGIISSHAFTSSTLKSSSSSSYGTKKFLCSSNDSQDNQDDVDALWESAKTPQILLIELEGSISSLCKVNSATFIIYDKFSMDWDKAWSSFRKQGGKKKSLFSQFSPNKYVSWNPRRSNYPLSEEVDPIKRAERSNLMLWTSPGFTLAGAIVLVTFLLIYTILAPMK